MDHITIVAELPDGTTSSIEAAPDFLQRLYALEAGGIQGKELFQALITEQWDIPQRLPIGSGSSCYGFSSGYSTGRLGHTTKRRARQRARPSAAQ